MLNIQYTFCRVSYNLRAYFHFTVGRFFFSEYLLIANCKVFLSLQSSDLLESVYTIIINHVIMSHQHDAHGTWQLDLERTFDHILFILIVDRSTMSLLCRHFKPASNLLSPCRAQLLANILLEVRWYQQCCREKMLEVNKEWACILACKCHGCVLHSPRQTTHTRTCYRLRSTVCVYVCKQRSHVQRIF